jgi:DNA-binding NarL/FixJ family response regulator
MTRPLRLVILNDNVEAAKRLAASISTDGVVVYSTDDPDETFQLISLLQHEVVLIDVEKLICTPAYPLESFREANPDVKIVGISRSKRGDTGLLLQLLDLDAYIHEPLTPEALISSLPEIADRYLMQSVGNASRQTHEDQNGQKWRLNPFVSARRSPYPQL